MLQKNRESLGRTGRSPPARMKDVNCLRPWFTLISAAPAFLSCPASAQGSVTSADEYPAKSVRVIVSYAPGGATDIYARLIAQKLSENTRQTFLVDNRTGAGGVIGDAVVARAAPDGYTLLATSSTFAINPAVVAKLPFDAIKDFAPISMVAGQAPFLLVIHPSVPARSVRDLVALAKAKPGKLNYASAGHGTVIHLAHELFNMMAGVTMTHIPYKGAGPAVTDLLAGQVQLIMTGIYQLRPYVESGKLRALAVSTKKRSAIMPEIPTVSESGVPGYEVASWYAWLAPAGTPAAVVNRLNAEIVRIVKAPDITARLVSDDVVPVGSTAEDFGRYLATEIARWRKVVKDAALPLQ